MLNLQTRPNYFRDVSETLAAWDLDYDSPELEDSVVPACCSEDCEVEPDGYCEHGCPSVLLQLGVI